MIHHIMLPLGRGRSPDPVTAPERYTTVLRSTPSPPGPDDHTSSWQPEAGEETFPSLAQSQPGRQDP